VQQLVIIGAGLSGLTAARALAGEYDIVVLDKGRGVGGRMATRRIGGATIDHGAQFFTTHTTQFADVVAGWVAAGVAEPWFAGRVGPHGVEDSDGHTRFRGVPTMNAVAQHLADGLDVRRSTPVQSVERDGERWRVSTLDESFTADAVLLTAPVPQSLALLAAGGVTLTAGDAARVGGDRVRAMPGRVGRARRACAAAGTWSGRPNLDGPVDWVADNQRKGVSAAPAVTVHASAEFTREHWDTDDDTVVTALLGALQLGSTLVPGGAQVHRWRYARPVTVHHARSLEAHGHPGLVFAGDAFGGAKVEGAVLSGLAAAEVLSARRTLAAEVST
jgi:renalase